MDISKVYFSFDGRLRRRHFWIYSILLWLCVVAFAAVFGGEVEGGVLHPFKFDGFGLLGFVVGIAALWAYFGVAIKRWHDRDKSWPWALMIFVPIIGWLWVLIECGFLEGTEGGNRFGASPK